MTSYEERLSQEQMRFDGEINVHDLPEIFHYWSNKYLRPILNSVGYDCIEDFFAQEALKVSQMRKSVRILGVGSGDCQTELDVVSRLEKMGVNDVHLHCIDISAEALNRAAEAARRDGVENVLFQQYDFNQGLPEGIWDVVIANQSLHHVERLETLFDAVKRQLEPDGAFLVSDMIGRNGHMRWPEAANIVNDIWEWLPEGYRFNRQLNRKEIKFLDWDCSKEGFEGIRAQDVLPLLIERFEPSIFLAWGNIIDVFIDRGFGHSFNAMSEWDTHFIDRVHEIDELAIKERRITPTHLLARFGIGHQKQTICLPGVPVESALRNIKTSRSANPIKRWFRKSRG